MATESLMPLPDWVGRDAAIEAGGPRPQRWSSSQMRCRVERIADALASSGVCGGAVGLLADNSPTWIAVDLAARAARISLVPVPGFFSREQAMHAVRASAMQALFCTDATDAARLGFSHEIANCDGLRLFQRAAAGPAVPRLGAIADIQKITFTSGTTGAPKGVALTADQQATTARALAEVTASLGITRHLSLLPLSVLLENVAGVYTALTTGATCILPQLEEVGLSGASGFDPVRCLNAIAHYRAHSVIVLPQMLQALVSVLTRTPGKDPRIETLKLVAVGGAKTPAALIARARNLGLPVYEGYGLSECGSVIAMNVPAADKPGTVGKALPGVRMRLAADGEIEVHGRSFAGYMLSAERPGAGLAPALTSAEGWFKTGDLGSIDGDDFVSIVGRKKNVLITSYGRNISPEWPESLLLESESIAQAAVFGEACPYLAAILVASGAHISDDTLDQAVARANARLPEYARIRAWLRASEGFTARNGFATANGRIRRDAILACYSIRLDALYRCAEGGPLAARSAVESAEGDLRS